MDDVLPGDVVFSENEGPVFIVHSTDSMGFGIRQIVYYITATKVHSNVTWTIFKHENDFILARFE